MSAHVWDRRRESKRLRIALRRAFKIIRADPLAVVPILDTGLVAMSPERHERLLALAERLDALATFNPVDWELRA